MEHQAREARRRAEEERARLAEWQAFEKRQLEAMEQAHRRHEAIKQMQQRLMAFQLREPTAAPSTPASEPKRSRTELSPETKEAAQREMIAATLAEIAAALNAVPLSLSTHSASPINALRGQVERYQRALQNNQTPEAFRIAALRQTATQSTAAFLERLAAERDERAGRVARADAALKLLMVLEQLPLSDPNPLRSARQVLMPSLAAGEISAAALDQVEHNLQVASRQAAEQMANAAVRPALAEALLRHLKAMGYEILNAFPDTATETSIEARVRIPGGEQVAIKMDEDARLRFNLMHERSDQQSAPLTQAEMAFARAQEQRWCKDLKTLVNRLTEDGFDSRVTFERACVAIPTVIVERFSEDQPSTAAETHQRDETDEQRRRRIQQAEQRKQRRQS